MRQVQDNLGWWARRGLRWHLVEVSEPLKAAQQEQLKGRGVHWWQDLAPALQSCDGAAWIYHNELLDAFPCQVWRWTEGRWQCLWLRRMEAATTGVQWQEVWKEGVADAAGSASAGSASAGSASAGSADSDGAEALHQALSAAAWLPPEGQRIERQPSIRRWLQHWVPHWRTGGMLSLDYGDLAPHLWQQHPRSSLRGYLMQQRLEGAAVYGNMGRQDITLDVNFTDYSDWLARLGVRQTGYQTQAQFFADLDVAAVTEREQQLLNPEGAGAAFKVLHHRL
jgi:SAM-dependent MidA family methyltransferase